jgi:hypothetical protein
MLCCIDVIVEIETRCGMCEEEEEEEERKRLKGVGGIGNRREEYILRLSERDTIGRAALT